MQQRRRHSARSVHCHLLSQFSLATTTTGNSPVWVPGQNTPPDLSFIHAMPLLCASIPLCINIFSLARTTFVSKSFPTHFFFLLRGMESLTVATLLGLADHSIRGV